MVCRNGLQCLVSVVLVLVLAPWGSAKTPRTGAPPRTPTGQPGTPPQSAAQVQAIAQELLDPKGEVVAAVRPRPTA